MFRLVAALLRDSSRARSPCPPAVIKTGGERVPQPKRPGTERRGRERRGDNDGLGGSVGGAHNELETIYHGARGLTRPEGVGCHSCGANSLRPNSERLDTRGGWVRWSGPTPARCPRTTFTNPTTSSRLLIAHEAHPRFVEDALHVRVSGEVAQKPFSQIDRILGSPDAGVARGEVDVRLRQEGSQM